MRLKFIIIGIFLIEEGGLRYLQLGFSALRSMVLVQGRNQIGSDR